MNSARKPIRLALQGGGSHGAFTWGVLDRLLEDPSLNITAASGTSAGALNAAMLVQGLVRGGPDAARDLLRRFWVRVANLGAGRAPDADPDAPALPMAAIFAGLLADPGALINGASQNPMRRILDGLLEPDVFGTQGAPDIVVAATRVLSGTPRLFRGAEVTEDALLASACLPQVFPAVVIDGEALWDGGFVLNPPLVALTEGRADCDVLIVRLFPASRTELPRGADAITHRTGEIAFSAPLGAELAALAAADRAAEPARRLPRFLRRPEVRLHMIADDGTLGPLPPTSRLDTGWPLIERLHKAGRAAAEDWLAQNRHQIGRSATLDAAAFAEAA